MQGFPTIYLQCLINFTINLKPHEANQPVMLMTLLICKNNKPELGILRSPKQICTVKIMSKDNFKKNLINLTKICVRKIINHN